MVKFSVYLNRLVMNCGAVALNASLFLFGVLDGRLLVIVSIPDHCHPSSSLEKNNLSDNMYMSPIRWKTFPRHKNKVM